MEGEGGGSVTGAGRQDPQADGIVRTLRNAEGRAFCFRPRVSPLVLTVRHTIRMGTSGQASDHRDA